MRGNRLPERRPELRRRARSSPRVRGRRRPRAISVQRGSHTQESGSDLIFFFFFLTRHSTYFRSTKNKVIIDFSGSIISATCADLSFPRSGLLVPAHWVIRPAAGCFFLKVQPFSVCTNGHNRLLLSLLQGEEIATNNSPLFFCSFKANSDHSNLKANELIKMLTSTWSRSNWKIQMKA